jgi:hypothetical protein
MLCVAIHDVAPATWPACLTLWDAVRAVRDIPLTWLVVPHFHGEARRDAAYESALDRLAARGHELALHGYTHLDEGAAASSLRDRLLRGVYTQKEGEFAALSPEEARRRIALGLGWFHAHGWRPAGFVPPAWLLSEGAWEVLRDCRFAYTTTYRYLHLLTVQRRVFSPALVYTARNRTGRLLSPPAMSLLAAALQRAPLVPPVPPVPLVRIALHPRDAGHPALLRHAQRLIARLLDGREALTKAGAAQRLAASPVGSPIAAQ